MSLSILKECFNKNLKEYKSIPFWSWNNELDENELIKQVQEMKACGMGGFIIHARTGLKTEYLGDKWFNCVKVCLEKAKELDMNAWIYDENGWPSGFVGGKLLEKLEYRAQFLEYKINDYYDEEAFCVYVKENNKYRRITKKGNSKEFHTIYICTSPANTDILNPDVVSQFIQLTHEEYYKRFKDSFGKELVGFFTDEPQFYRYQTPYSKTIFTEINEKEVLDNLIYLFLKDEEGYPFRIKYYSALNRLYVNNFYKRIYNWCNEHNCKLTGHSIEEGALHAQMYGGANVSTSYEYEHIPAIDWLGRVCGNELAPKQVSSVCAQLGIKHILTETFACSGYDVTPYELKSIGDFQYFNGVNMMCHHLFPYSLAGGGKYDHPPVFSNHNNWFNEMKQFNEYFDRLGYLIANTEEVYDVGIIHPIKNVYLDYIRDEDYKSVKILEDSFNNLLSFLRKNGVMFQLIDEEILKKYGKIKDGKLIVGKKEYTNIIIPDMKSISLSTLNLLYNYNYNILLMNNIEYVDGVKQDVYLKSNITIDELLKNKKIKYSSTDGRSFMTSRSSDLGNYIFIKNNSIDNESEVIIEGVSNNYQRLDLLSLKLDCISDKITLKPSEGIILMKNDNFVNYDYNYQDQDITKNFRIYKISENFLVLDNALISFDGIVYSDYKPLQAIFDDLLYKDYQGEIYLKQVFKVNNYLNLKLIMEKDSFDEVYINGHYITLCKGKFDENFYQSDITKYITLGENEIIYKLNYYQHDGVHFALFDPLATESVRNCLYYDKSLENNYLKGDFIVEDDLSLSRIKEYPSVNSSLEKCGYPFFKGEVYYNGEYNYDGNGDVILKIDGRFICANIYINDIKIDIVLDNEIDITDYLSLGKNRLKIYLKSSLRNLFGPHHYKHNNEPFGVHPGLFNFRSMWVNKDYNDFYTDKYNVVSFGIKTIIMKKRFLKI